MLHSVGVGSKGADIDHVLIGPAGIVTVVGEHGFLHWLRRLPLTPAIEANAATAGEVTVERILRAPADASAQAVHALAKQVEDLPLWATNECDANGVEQPADHAGAERRFIALQRSRSRARTVRRVWSFAGSSRTRV